MHQSRRRRACLQTVVRACVRAWVAIGWQSGTVVHGDSEMGTGMGAWIRADGISEL